MKNLYLLFIKFFKIGLFTFGGGYAMISLIQSEVVENMKWIDDKDMVNMIVIAQTTPGVLAVNTATFVGYRVAGIAGAACATFGAILPSVIIIGVISLFFDAFKSLKYVAYAFDGIKAGVVLLIANAIITLDKKNPKDIFYYIVLFSAIIVSSAYIVNKNLKVNIIYILLASAVIGIIYSLVKVKFFADKNKSNKGGGV